ncbi:glycosyltransferase family 2 protein [Cellulomonas aerilata]|uniref:Glycosyl transferase n=1 Tax=Cellulomonas aerilata TaxID=515326 RepID=A0A512DF18_9CELL|nr:glycosyltransferase family A protein [Cellulomonas aerilata]GEO35073.1 glycosyl transferase [Cellulomonas aerilata]
MRLTVVIPVKDGRGVVGQQLDALLAQVGLEDFEVLVVDNGSTDGTPDLVRTYAGRDPRVRLLEARDRAGASHARNAGLRAARSPSVAFCDADDVVSPGWAAAMADALEHHALVGGPLEWDRLNPTWAARARGRVQKDGWSVLVPGPPWPYPFAANTGVRRSVALEVGGYDEDLPWGGEDNDFAYRLRAVGIEPVWVPDAVVHYRARTDLLGLYRQGRGYGGGFVALARRWPEGWPEQPSAPSARQRLRFAPRLVRSVLRGRSHVAATLFQLGWSNGVAAEVRDGRRRASPAT